MPEPAHDRLGAGGACGLGVVDEPAQSSQVFGVLVAQHVQDPPRWDQAAEPAVVVDDGETALVDPRRLPRCDLLVGLGADGRRRGVHQRVEPCRLGRGEELLDGDQPQEVLALADGDGDGAVVAAADHGRPGLPRRDLGPERGHVRRGVATGLLELRRRHHRERHRTRPPRAGRALDGGARRRRRSSRLNQHGSSPGPGRLRWRRRTPAGSCARSSRPAVGVAASPPAARGHSGARRSWR